MRSRKIDMDLLRRRISRTRGVVAYARAPLVAFLRGRLVSLSASPRLILTGVTEGGTERELMCRFIVEGDGQGRSFVAPLSQLSFGRDGQFSHALSRKRG
jgi:hypothetical protein